MISLLVLWTVLFSVVMAFLAGASHAGSATLTWTKGPETDIAGAKLYMREEGASYGAPMSTIVGKDIVTIMVNIPEKPLARKVYFTLTFYDTSDNESGFSNEVNKLIAGAPVVVHPQMVKPVLTTTAQTEISVTLTWPAGPDGIGGVAKIDIRFAVAPLNWGSATSTTCTVSPCTITGLTKGTAYQFQGIYYRGIPNQSSVFGPMGSPLSVSTKDLPPLPPAGLTISKNTIDQVIVVAKVQDCRQITTEPVIGGATHQIVLNCIR